ncbi:MAG: hypothetical protein ACUVTL_06235 [Thermoproteota archaeon]
MILNLFQREGPFKLKVPESSITHLKEFVFNSVERRPTMYTDQYTPYKLL